MDKKRLQELAGVEQLDEATDNAESFINEVAEFLIGHEFDAGDAEQFCKDVMKEYKYKAAKLEGQGK